MIQVLRRTRPWPDATVVIMRWCGRAAPRRWRSSRSPSGSTRSRARPSPCSGTICSAATRSSRSSKQELGKRFPGVSFVDYDAFGSTHGDEEHACSAELPGEDQVDEGRRGHLRHGVLRKLHARRVAGQRGGGAGRRAHLLACVRGLPRPGRRRPSIGLGLSEPATGARAGPRRRADVGRAARQRARHDGRRR